jgi:hypothetical protein
MRFASSATPKPGRRPAASSLLVGGRFPQRNAVELETAASCAVGIRIEDEQSNDMGLDDLGTLSLREKSPGCPLAVSQSGAKIVPDRFLGSPHPLHVAADGVPICNRQLSASASLGFRTSPLSSAVSAAFHSAQIFRIDDPRDGLTQRYSD